MEWKTSHAPVEYAYAVRAMEARVRDIRAGKGDEQVWLLEHPPLYTAGTSANPADIIGNPRFPVHKTGRGGQYTYHGPGQRIAYVMLDLQKRKPDLRRFVGQLEQWIIHALATLGIQGELREGRIGVWVKLPLPPGEADFVSEPQASLRNPVRGSALRRKRCTTLPSPNPLPEGEGFSTEAKIAALGIRVRQWVTYHGISINVNPDLSHYTPIVPCGIREHGVTSLAALGVKAGMKELDEALKQTFEI